MPTWHLVFFGSVLGALGAFGVSRLGARFGLLDHPNARSSHQRVTPKGGGIGILAACVAGSIWIGLSFWFWLSVLILSGVSFWGDRSDLSVSFRLWIQFISASVAVWGTDRFLYDETFWYSPSVWPICLVSIFFVVLTTNMFNFMDGINGVAGLSGMIAFILLAVSGWQRGESEAMIGMACLLAASCMGFLPFNFPKARVFMGDVGSILLGFVYAIYVVSWSRSFSDVLMFVAFMFPFFSDETITLWTRLRSGDSLRKAHRRHVYQVLVNQMGIAHWRVSLGYGGFQLLVGMMALALYPLGWTVELASILIIGIISFIVAQRVRSFEKRSDG